MRWFWIDRYTEFVSGRRATAVKNISLAEDHLHDHFPIEPVMPNSLVLEGLAQAAGLLVGEQSNFGKQVVLAKVPHVKFHFLARPGDTLTYRVNIKEIDPRGAMVKATSHVGERLQAEAEIFFAQLETGQHTPRLFKTAHFMTWLRFVQLYEVGRTEDGRELTIPAELAATESTGDTST